MARLALAVCLLALACATPARATKCYDADSFLAVAAPGVPKVLEACAPFESGVPACRAACRDYVIAEQFPTCDADGNAMRTCKSTCTTFATACGVPDVMCLALSDGECSAGAPTPKAKFEEKLKVMRQLLSHDGSGSGSGYPGITLTVDGEEMDMAGFMYGIVFPIIYSDVYTCRPDMAGSPMDEYLQSDEFSDHIQNFVLSNYMTFSTTDVSQYLLCTVFKCTSTAACTPGTGGGGGGGLPEFDDCAPAGVGGLAALTACPDEVLAVYGADYMARCPAFYFTETSDLFGMTEYTNSSSGETEAMEKGYWIVEPANMRGTLTSEMVSVPLRMTLLQSYLDTYDPDYMFMCVYDRCYHLDRCALEYILTLDPTGMMLQTPSLVGVSGKLYQYAKFIPTEDPPTGTDSGDARRLLQEMGYIPRAGRGLLATNPTLSDTVLTTTGSDNPTSGGKNYNVKGYNVNVGPPQSGGGTGSGSGMRRRSLLQGGGGHGSGNPGYNPCDEYNSDNASRRRLLAHFAENHGSEDVRAESRRQLLEVDAAIAATEAAARGYSAGATEARHRRRRALLGLDAPAVAPPCDSVCQFLDAYFGRVAHARPDLTAEDIRALLEERHADVALETAIAEYQEAGGDGGIEAALEYAVPALDELLGLTGPESRARLLVETSPPSDADHYNGDGDGDGSGDPWGSGEWDTMAVQQDPPFNYRYEEGAGSKYSTDGGSSNRRRALLYHPDEATRRRLLSDECDATDPSVPGINQNVNMAGVQCFQNTIYTDRGTKTCGARADYGSGSGSGAGDRRRALLAAGPDKISFPEFLRVLRAGRAFSNDENAVIRGRRLLSHDGGSGSGGGPPDIELDFAEMTCTVDDPALTCTTTFVPQECGANWLDTYVTNTIGETTIITLKSCYCGDECTYDECYPADGSCSEYEPQG